jgi:adenylate cyclase
MPTMRTSTKRQIGSFRRALSLGAVTGAVVGSAAGGSALLDAPLLGAVLGALSGVINMVTMTAVIGGAEIFLPRTRLGHALERAPFLVTFAAKWLVYGAVILLVLGSRLGRRLAVAMLLSRDLAQTLDQQIKGTPPAQSIAATFVGTFFFILLLQLSRIVGERTLRDIVFGRYHRPRTEERFFLFVDIAGSTPLAERIGPAAVHRFLGRVFRVASAPIDDHGGEIYQYVGDEIVITWTVSEGRKRARPLGCFFATEQALERATPEFEREFGAVPRLHAALHAGPVIAGEVGESRRAIVFHGDVMNTTSRLEQAARDVERQFLVSGDALDRLEGLEAHALEDLGRQRLRGRAASVHVYAVTAKPLTGGQNP